MNEQNYLKNTSPFDFNTFKYEERSLRGVNGKAFVEFNHHISCEEIRALEDSVNLGLAKCKKFESGFILGEVIPEQKDLFPGPLEGEVLLDINEYDPTGYHQNIMKTLDRQERRRYLYFALGVVPPWYGTVYLRRNNFHTKTEHNKSISEWEDEAKHFPELVQFVEGLKGKVFSEIGRVMFFITYPNTPVVTHRDDIDVRHKDHFINIYFKGPRKTFIWDSLKKEKTYLKSGVTAFFFNDRDYHGIDAEPSFNYTLRIDGVFAPSIQDELGLINGFVWQLS